jgi:hypothetical protein
MEGGDRIVLNRARVVSCCAMPAAVVAAVVAALFATTLAAGSAAARGWEPPRYGAALAAFGTSKAFPGSIGAGPDRGLEPRAEISSSLRLSGSVRLGVSANAGGRLQQEFTKGNYGWFGLAATLRHDRTTYSLAGEWTPRRNKFPTDPEEGGEYHGASLSGGVRRSLGRRVRLRLEGSVERERFVPQFSLRNATGRELFAQAAFSASGRLELRGEASLSHDQVASPRYSKYTHWLGAGGVWSDSLWRAELGARSGVRRYPEAVLGDSDFRRRDQWIELRARLTRGLRPGLAASTGATLVDQMSSRIDRSYSYATFTLGLDWTGGR